MIRKALSQDLDSIRQLTKACAGALQAKHIYQWNESYPSKERLAQDIEREELFVLEENSVIKGIIVLTFKMDKEYEPIEWLTPNENNLYVHRFATHPKVWGKGYGRQLMDFAEVFAAENRYRSIRLDTFSQNERNKIFYETRGYVRLGNVFFPNQSEYPFYCYEKTLS